MKDATIRAMALALALAQAHAQLLNFDILRSN